MSDLTVWRFDSADGAERVLDKLRGLSKEHLLDIKDAAMVTWPSGKKKPRTRQALPMTSMGALDGAFWGMLFGLIFFVPFLGAAVGALSGALAGHFTDYGIDDDFIKQVRESVTEGSSALFLLTGDVTLDKVEEQLAGEKPHLLKSNLTHEQEERLREHFPGA